MREKTIQLLKTINPEVRDGVNLIEEGIIDSFSVVNIVAEIESEFQIEIDPEDIISENFESVDNIVSLVKKYLG